MSKIQRLMRLHRLMAPATEGADGGGGASESSAAGESAQADAAAATTLMTAEADATNDGATNAEAAEKQPAKAADKPEGAPEAYKDFTLPDGVKLEGEAADAFKGLAKELNLTQDQAQKLADLGAKQAQDGQARQAEILKAANAEWTAQSQADKEFGGENLSQNLAIARKAMDTFATPELKQLLTESGLGNHPEVIRMFFRTGKAISEDSFVSAARGAKPKGDLASRLYPSTTSQ
ncbi:protease [Comamonas sp. C24C]